MFFIFHKSHIPRVAIFFRYYKLFLKIISPVSKAMVAVRVAPISKNFNSAILILPGFTECTILFNFTALFTSQNNQHSNYLRKISFRSHGFVAYLHVEVTEHSLWTATQKRNTFDGDYFLEINQIMKINAMREEKRYGGVFFDFNEKPDIQLSAKCECAARVTTAQLLLTEFSPTSMWVIVSVAVRFKVNTFRNKSDSSHWKICEIQYTHEGKTALRNVNLSLSENRCEMRFVSLWRQWMAVWLDTFQNKGAKFESNDQRFIGKMGDLIMFLLKKITHIFITEKKIFA